jgi:hypothetical protein
MENPSKVELLIKEMRQLYKGSPVNPAIRIGKGKFITLEQAHQDIVSKKIRFLSWWLSCKGVRLKKSNTSESIYFPFNAAHFRVSDHKPFNMSGIDHNIIIKFDTCIIQVLCQIHLLSLKLDNYEG